MLADTILALPPDDLQALKKMLADDTGEPDMGVAAIIPTDPRPREGGAEVPFENWPDDYWESQA